MPDHRYRALTLDAAGTLLHLKEPVGVTYARIGRAYGVTRSPDAIHTAFSKAMKRPWPGRRFDGDGRPFWQSIVAQSTGVADPDYFEAIYGAFGAPAWSLAPDAEPVLDALRTAGVRIALISNWDQRLRPLLRDLGVLDMLDEAVISGEVELEKPDLRIFAHAAQRLGVRPEAVVHVGDRQEEDIAGAQRAGMTAWLYGQDVRSFPALAARILGTG